MLHNCTGDLRQHSAQELKGGIMHQIDRKAGAGDPFDERGVARHRHLIAAQAANADNVNGKQGAGQTVPDELVGKTQQQDGELARLSGKSSSWGHWYDLYCDSIVNVVLFVGIGIGLTESTLGHWAWKMGVLSGLSIALTFWIVFRLHESGSTPSEAFNAPDGFDFDDSMFLICIFAWFDGMFYLLIAASVCAPLFLIFAVWQYVTLKSSTPS